MTHRDEPIAIVGMACRYPGAPDLDAYWTLLTSGTNALEDVPAARWDIDLLYHPDPAAPGKVTSRRGGFLEHLDRFDAAFFGISPREAPHVDPRQRVMLEIVWEALEHAGIAPDRLAGTAAGVFVATLTNDYRSLLFADLARLDAFSGAGTATSIVANRISYFFDLRGPSIAIDTACSGSLVALHAAVESLRRGESAIGIAGGVSVNLMADSNVFFSKAGLISPEGKCRTFDSQADGIIRSDGAGVLILKRLADATRDGDRVLAVVTGTATNHGGRTHGIMVPNAAAQTAVITEACRRAGIRAGDLQYIEAHGTGTKLGDPIEVDGIAGAIGDGRADGHRCLIGSVKTNIGHTEPAAGMAGVIKTVLAIGHRQIPANLHFEQANPLIPFDRLPLDVPTALTPWPVRDGRLIAGVSGFGFGGSNAHVIIENAPASAGPLPATRSVDSGLRVLPVSARTEQALRDHVRAHRDWLAERPTALDAACYTAGVKRAHLPHRAAFTARSSDDMRDALDRWLDQRAGSADEAAPGADPARLVFVFSGQGSHHPGMGRELYRTEPVYRRALEDVGEALAPHVSWSLIDQLEQAGNGPRPASTEILQPAIFAVQMALAALWRSWGVTPDVVIGHSLGEIAAACVAGALTLDDAARVVVHRSRLMARVAGQGLTASIGLGLDEAYALVGESAALAVAGSNSPGSSLLSGAPAEVTRAVDRLTARGVHARLLQDVDIAFHSPQMDALVPELTSALRDIRPRAAAVPIVSSVTGGATRGETMDAEYWGRNLRQPFLFADATAHLFDEGRAACLEVSPHPVLASALVQSARHAGRADAVVLPSLRKGTSDAASMRQSLAALYQLGRPVEWRALWPSGGEIADLPTYPWQRERYWFDQLSGSREDTAPRKRSGDHPLLGERVEPAAGAGAARQMLWEIDFEPQRPRYLADHRVFGDVVLPGAAMLEMLHAAGHQIAGGDGVAIEDVVFESPLRIAEGARVRAQVLMTIDGGTIRAGVFSRPAGADAPAAWTAHATASVRVRAQAAHDAAAAMTLDERRARSTAAIAPAEHYAAMLREGVAYGPAFSVITELAAGGGESFARLSLPPGMSDQAYTIHPALLDGALQTVAAAVSGASAGGRDAYLPQGVGAWQIARPAGRAVWAHARLESALNGDHLDAAVDIVDDEGGVIATLRGFRLKRTGRSTQALAGALIDTQWEAAPHTGDAAPAAGNWVVLADRGGVGARVADRLRASGCQVVVVDEPAALGHALASASDLSGVVHLWSLDAAEAGVLMASGCAHALETVQRLAALPQPPRLWLVTRGARACGEAPIALAQAPMIGFGLTVAQEHPELRCTLVDLEPGVSPGDATAMIAADLAAPAREQHVAWRNGARLAARLSAAPAPPAEPASLDAGATYLITGGFGTLGLLSARLLVERGARHLVLTGRRGAAGHGQDVDALERMGATVTAAALDISQAADAASLFDDLLPRLPRLAGVIHAAGVLDDALLTQTSPARFDAVMAPKVLGAAHLHARTAPLALDFFVLFSSAASLLGSAGQAGYAAANAYLDALAHHRRASGLPAVSINWGLWADGGMGAEAGVEARMAARGVAAIAPRDGLALLDAWLGPETPAQIGVLPIDWPVFLRQFPSGVPSLFARFSDRERREPPARAIAAAASPEARAALVLEVLREDVATVLGIRDAKSIGLRDRFFDLGMDSLMAVELRNRLQASFDQPFSSTIAFDCPSLDALAARVRASIEPVPAPDAAAAPFGNLSDAELARQLARELAD